MMKTKVKQNSVSRRNLLKFGAGFIGAGSLATALGVDLQSPLPAVAQNNITPDEALALLMEGNQRFVQQKHDRPNQTSLRIAEVAESQAPFAAILGCADSRVPAELIFDRGIGDLFIGRVAGNIATDEEIGSLEYGTLVLGAKVIMVLGHERCGAVKAALEGGSLPGQLGSLIDGIQVAVERSAAEAGESKLDAAIFANILYQKERLERSEVLADLVAKGSLKIVGAYYDLDEGIVTLVES